MIDHTLSKSEFMVPPDSAKPSIWWFWGESITTNHGITQDLEALKRVGFGGVVVYEQVFSDVPDAFDSLSPQWLACFRHAAAECARLGMDLEVNVGNGFVAGGPWITPELGMQRLVFSERNLEGGAAVSVQLPMPPVKFGCYRDVAVLAWPARAGSGSVSRPAVHSAPDGIDVETLLDVEAGKTVNVNPGSDGSSIIRFDYPEPFTARSLTYSMCQGSKALVIATQMPGNWDDDFLGQGMKPIPPVGELEASTDGRTWKAVCSLPGLGYQHDYWRQQTVAFPATTARHFRLNLHGWNQYNAYKDGVLPFGPVQLCGEARIDRWETKSGNKVDFSDPDRTPAYGADEIIDPQSIVDLTDRLDSDGVLHWEAPSGRWTVMRFGHTPTGGKTKHGRPNAMGLECDKLSSRAADVQFDNYVGVLLEEVRKVPGARLAGINIDSAEHGSQNWTAGFAEAFRERRGYDLLRFLPAMAGRVIESPNVSDRFLYDLRRTIADMMSDCYFGRFKTRCNAEGMLVSAEAPGIATCLPSDNIQAKARSDIPMGEFWMSQPKGTMDCKETGSAAHVYGIRLAGAEAFTGSRPDAHPAMMKPFADAAFANGINRLVALAFVHQPWDDRKPGVTEDRFYLPYQRHNTWWEYARCFWDTLSRSCLMLRKGLPAADLLYHLSDDTPLKITTHRMRPVPPRGWDYDVCGDEVLLTRVSVENGRIVLPDGTSYRLLVLAGGERVTVAAARKVKELAYAGAAILGGPPWIGSPSLADVCGGDDEVRSLAGSLWGSSTPAAQGLRLTGRGKFLWGYAPESAMRLLETGPDVDVPAGESGSDVLWLHRRTKDEDIYFLANHVNARQEFTTRFRIEGRVPELWNPHTGEVCRASAWTSGAGHTELELQLEAYDSVFVVFRVSSDAPPQRIPVAGSPTAIEGPWELMFTPGWGAPERLLIDRLVSWTEHPDFDIRHYSGTVVYKKEINLPALLPGEYIELELGKVANVASATLNGVALGTCWKAPWRFWIDCSKAGPNQLEIAVANLWVNRLIADAGLPESERRSWVTWNPLRPDEPLLPSGLLGPVSFRVMTLRTTLQ